MLGSEVCLQVLNWGIEGRVDYCHLSRNREIKSRSAWIMVIITQVNQEMSQVNINQVMPKFPVSDPAVLLSVKNFTRAPHSPNSIIIVQIWQPERPPALSDPIHRVHPISSQQKIVAITTVTLLLLSRWGKGKNVIYPIKETSSVLLFLHHHFSLFQTFIQFVKTFIYVYPIGL